MCTIVVPIIELQPSIGFQYLDLSTMVLQNKLEFNGPHQIHCICLQMNGRFTFKIQFSTYIWAFMPFGLSNTLSIFMRVMNQVFNPILENS